MCAQERRGVRLPATKFPNLQKKIAKQRPVQNVQKKKG